MRTERDKLRLKTNKAAKEASRKKAAEDFVVKASEAANTPAAKKLRAMVDSKASAARKVAESKGLKGKKATEFVNTQLQLLYKQKDFKALQAKSAIKYTK